MSKWAGYCPKCEKWRTHDMSGKPSLFHHRLQDNLEDVKDNIVCKRMHKYGRQGHWHDPQQDEFCNTPLLKSKDSTEEVKV
jgi:hypothetical protein